MLNYTPYTREQFNQKFMSQAEQRKNELMSSKPVEYFLDSMWEEMNKWYKEQYPQKYRESLTLEQLAREGR